MPYLDPSLVLSYSNVLKTVLKRSNRVWSRIAGKGLAKHYLNY